MKPTLLAEVINEFSANELGVVLRTAGVTDVPGSKQAKIALWLRIAGDPARIRRALDQLSPAGRRALEILQDANATLRTRRLRSLLIRAGVAAKEEESPFRYTQPGTASSAAQKSGLPPFFQVLEELLRHGLIWTHTPYPSRTANTTIDFRGGRYVFIPAEVAAHLPPLPVKERLVPQIVQTLAGSARTCQRDLYLLWSASRETTLQLTNAGLVRVTDLRRVAGQLLVAETIKTGSKESDYRRLLFMRCLAGALDILKVRGYGSHLEATLAPPFFSQRAATRVQRSFEEWRDGLWWNELWATHMGSTSSTDVLARQTPAPVPTARRAVLAALTELVKQIEKGQGTSAAWVTLDELDDYLLIHNDEFLVDRLTAEKVASSYGYQPYSFLFLSPYDHNELGWAWPMYQNNEEAGWKGVESAFMRSVLTEGLYWLGLVDLGYAQPVTPQGGAAPDGVAAVRLTEMGRWLLLGTPPPEIPEERGRVVVQPNFRIFAFDPISDAVLVRLDSFANRQNAARAIEYELSRDSVYGAQLEGQSTAQIAAWLEEVTGSALPQNVARSLTEWQSDFERITVHKLVGWLEAATPALIEALLNDPRCRPAVISRASPTGLIVRASKVAELERALLDAEELPTRIDNPFTARQHTITVDEDGLITFLQPIPNLYTLGPLSSFCEQTAAGWQITPRSMARASAAGQDAEAVLAGLREMAVGDISMALQAKIKAWSHHYGTAQVETITLVQFRDQDTLDELRRNPRLARYLKPFKPEARLGLATVAPSDVAAVNALLVECGVEVKV